MPGFAHEKLLQNIYCQRVGVNAVQLQAGDYRDLALDIALFGLWGQRPPLGLGRQVCQFDVDDFERPVLVFRADSRNYAARTQIVALHDRSRESQSSRLVFEHDLVLAVRGDVLVPHGRRNNPLLPGISRWFLPSG